MLTHTQDHSTMSLRNRRCSWILALYPPTRQGLSDWRPLPPANLFTSEPSAFNWK